MDRPRILHAEDQATVAEAIQMILAQIGCQVDSVPNGAEALERVRKDPSRYQMVLTDCNMPVLTGRQLVEELRAMKYGGKIVVLSALQGDESEAVFDRLKVDGIIQKPFQIQELLQVISDALGGR
jgi:two-component system chemotaxis sensor kinase CheA/two-component system chemotaxis response regulator CheY